MQGVIVGVTPEATTDIIVANKKYQIISILCLHLCIAYCLYIDNKIKFCQDQWTGLMFVVMHL